MAEPIDSSSEKHLRRLLAAASAAHAEALATRDRLLAAWAAVAAQQKRAAAEWAEANRYFTEQTAALDARAAELDRREKALVDRWAQAEAQTAGLREEAAALERRVHNARVALAELERRRDQVWSELLGPRPAGRSDADRLADEKAAVAALRASLERERTDLDDRRRVVAEQLALLTEARTSWARAEQQTMIEMEDLARELVRREQELDARERRLIRADIRRREEAHHLWRLRLRLEAWQSRLTAAEAREQAAVSSELAVLRSEVERLAAVLMDLEPPEVAELPLAAEESDRAAVLAFGPDTRAA